MTEAVKELRVLRLVGVIDKQVLAYQRPTHREWRTLPLEHRAIRSKQTLWDLFPTKERKTREEAKDGRRPCPPPFFTPQLLSTSVLASCRQPIRDVTHHLGDGLLVRRARRRL